MKRPTKQQVAAHDALMDRKHRVTLSNRSMIELAYAVKGYIELAAGNQVTIDLRHCLGGCFSYCHDLLNVVDNGYLLPCHRELRDFYRKDFDSYNIRA